VLVIFGATGDLTHRKLLPALYNLAIEQPLPPQFSVVGVARRPFSNEEFRQQAMDSINQFSRRTPVNPAVWDTFSKGLFYCQSQFDDPEGYQKPPLLLGDAAKLLPRHRRHAAQSRRGETRQGSGIKFLAYHRREAIWE
jgi:glucose-6-phosphate 1-dehydrogenase